MTIFTSDEEREIEKNTYLNDFCAYLSFLGKGTAQLTQKGNMNLATLELISKFIPYPDFILEDQKLRSVEEWPYLEKIIVLADLMKLTQKQKQKKIFLKRGKDYLSTSPSEQYLNLFLSYWQVLNWSFLFPFGNDETKHFPAEILQTHQVKVLEFLLSCPTDEKINFASFAEHFRESLQLKITNIYGDLLPKRVQDCIRVVLIDEFELFGLIRNHYQSEKIGSRIFKKLDSFQMTPLGIKVMKSILPSNAARFSIQMSLN